MSLLIFSQMDKMNVLMSCEKQIQVKITGGFSILYHIYIQYFVYK